MAKDFQEWTMFIQRFVLFWYILVKFQLPIPNSNQWAALDCWLVFGCDLYSFSFVANHLITNLQTHGLQLSHGQLCWLEVRNPPCQTTDIYTYVYIYIQLYNIEIYIYVYIYIHILFGTPKLINHPNLKV